MANILNKSRERIFRAFQNVVLPLSSEGSGDVKYHVGSVGTYTTPSGREVEVHLSANPSHLEAVDPVVCGMARGHQDQDGDVERRRTMTILIHGDAAFTGQGVVTENLQMSGLPGYTVGGTVHLVVNNQIGFTAGPRDLYSTNYCTDIAKSIEAPILHANGDYPESVLRATHVAVDYHTEFGRDVVIDMVCYRRRGHNEGDEPAYTQPLLYQAIAEHPSVRENYINLLVRRGVMTRQECEGISERYDEQLRESLEAAKRNVPAELPIEEIVDLEDDDPGDWCDHALGEVATGQALSREQLVDLIDRSNRMPEGHVVHPNLLRQLRRRESMVRGERDLDWGCAEVLAFASLLQNGVPIRIAGQDSGRGTFSHRHSVVRDQATGDDFLPLQQLAADSASFEVRDSLLSEEAAVAFEYGYSVVRPEALVIWEAQFGDFANGAQIPIDQFLVAGHAKWQQRAGLVLLLPHGYDGQGPEHSSARVERFLQMSAEGNLVVANCSMAVQYYRLLRRHAMADEQCPMVLFTPKSLLRDPRAASPIEDFEQDLFREVLDDPGADPARVERLVLCSGKIYHDLADFRRKEERKDVALVRLEQLYPFPRRALLDVIARYPKAKLIWAQEESRNMGAWSYLCEKLSFLGLRAEYAGRPASASPATGSYKRHTAEQEYLVRRAFGATAAVTSS